MKNVVEMRIQIRQHVTLLASVIFRSSNKHDANGSIEVGVWKQISETLGAVVLEGNDVTIKAKFPFGCQLYCVEEGPHSSNCHSLPETHCLEAFRDTVIV